MKKVLVLVRLQGAKLPESVLYAISAGQKLGEVSILLAGNQVEKALNEARFIKGIKKLWWIEDQKYEAGVAEDWQILVESLNKHYEVILTVADSFAKSLLPRLAARFKNPFVANVVDIVDDNTFVHPIYTGSVLEILRVKSKEFILTVRPSAFNKATKDSQQVIAKEVKVSKQQVLSDWQGKASGESAKDVASAKTVVAGGRGLKTKENFHALLQPLADVLHAAIGASRAVVEADFIGNEAQIGQTGKIIAPDLYIGVGISGALQHISGIQESKVIVAINKDPEAPLFAISDYILVADADEAIPRLTELIREKNSR